VTTKFAIACLVLSILGLAYLLLLAPGGKGTWRECYEARRDRLGHDQNYITDQTMSEIIQWCQRNGNPAAGFLGGME